jgi:hypothetical protein
MSLLSRINATGNELSCDLSIASALPKETEKQAGLTRGK